MKNLTLSASDSYFIRQHSLAIRIWHWISFMFISGSMITVLFASIVLNPRDNIGMVQEQLQNKGVTVTQDQAFAVSHEYEDKVWGIHKWIGFGVAVLLLSRFVVEIVQPGEEKLRLRLKNAIGLYKLNDENKSIYRHYLGVKASYSLFYILLICMTLTGLGLAFGRDVGFSRELHGTIKEIHSIGQYLIYAFIIVHLAGVITADNTEAKGIISGMINGNN